MEPRLQGEFWKLTIANKGNTKKKLINSPTVISRGFIYMKGNEALTSSLANEAKRVAEEELKKTNFNENLLNPECCKQCAVGNILDQKDAWEVVTFGQDTIPIAYSSPLTSAPLNQSQNSSRTQGKDNKDPQAISI